MQDSDKKQFAQIVRSTMLICGGDAPEPDVLRIWWASLMQHDLEVVSAAFSQYAIRGKHAPKPADILEIIDRLKPDGRPGADEAWAMIPRDEYCSAVMSQEMSEAWGIAKPLLDEGDQVAARKSFLQAYVRIVEQNKQAGIAVKWYPSLGRDVEMRISALTEAVRLGRMGAEHAASLLPPDKSISLLETFNHKLAIEDKSVVDFETAKANIAKLKLLVSNSNLVKSA